MTHNRRQCAALFLETEYDELTIEAYSQSRVTTERLKNGRFPFSCIHCKVVQKDKNMISYHRMFNLCSQYKGIAALKMYPTWEKSDHGELSRIAKKYGKDFNQTTLAKPAAGSKRKAAEDIEVPIEKRRPLASTPAPTTQLKELCRISRKTLQTSNDTRVHEVSDDSDGVEVCEDGRSDGPSQIHCRDDDTPPVPAATAVVVQSSSPVTTFPHGDFRIVEHSRVKRALTRAEVEECAWATSTLKYPDGNASCVPPPPTPVDKSALYILLTETKNDWMPKELIDNPDDCIPFLHKMVDDGTLGVKLCTAFGHWYLYNPRVRNHIYKLFSLKLYLFCFFTMPCVTAVELM